MLHKQPRWRPGAGAEERLEGQGLAQCSFQGPTAPHSPRSHLPGCRVLHRRHEGSHEP